MVQELGFCELLCDQSVTEASCDTATALALAELAIAVSREIREWKPAAPGWLGSAGTPGVREYGPGCTRTSFLQ